VALQVIQSAGSPAGNASTVAFSLATTPTPGNVLLAFAGYNSTIGGLTPPSTVWTSIFNANNSGSNDALACWLYTVKTNDPKTWSFASAGDYHSGELYEITGSSGVNGFVTHGGSGGTGTIAITGLAPTVNGCLPFAAYSDDTGTPVNTTISTWTVLTEAGTYHGGSSAYRTLTVDSSTVSCTFSSTGNNFGAWSSAVVLMAPTTSTATTYTFTAIATDNVTTAAATAMTSFVVTGSGGPPPPPVLTITSGSPLPDGEVGTAYSQTLTANGGVTPYTWSVASGTVPSGTTLSTAGVLSGTPTTAATYSFGAKVTDSETPAKNTTATFSVTMDANLPVLFQGSYPANGEHPTYTNSGQDSTFTLPGTTGNAYVDANVWGPVANETVELTVYGETNWLVTANIVNSSGGVTCFPNSAPNNPVSYNWSAANYLISGWDETMDTASGIIASACYDNWVNSTLTSNPLGAAINEIMWHFDFRNRGAGPWYALNVPFGGETVNGVAIPKTYWNLAASGTALFWNQTDGNGNIYSTPIGAIDVKAMMTWLVTNGWISAGCDFVGFSLGFEICNTNGNNNNFKYNNMWVQAG
jgi:hypothetical protein